MTQTVHLAEPYRPYQLHSLGKANYMLLRQTDFPYKLEEEDEVQSIDSDRCDYEIFRDICLRLTGDHQDSHIELWLRQAPNTAVMKFVQAVHGTTTDWHGYRVMATVGDNGHTIWTLQLSKLGKRSSTDVYTGDEAPNVLPGPRNR